jgi:hypothetical protein
LPLSWHPLTLFLLTNVSVTATGGPAVQIAAAAGESTTVTVSAGQVAQFNLQATPGNGFNGTLTFSCSGVPFGQPA